jgi:NAD(P)-dependent dehydrogenase (short-subunit alcohol dehydrogenase family)
VTGLCEGRRAVVTGGASGIGLATCRRLVAEGARVAILDVQQELAQAAARELGGLAFAADVGDAATVESAMQAAARELGGLDLLFNNAGAGSVRSLHRYTPEDVERLVRVNLLGVYNGLRAAIPLMLAGAGGAIVNNASASATQPVRGEAPYAAAKAGVLALTRSAALEYGPRIRVNSVSPGMIRTALSEGLFRAPGALDPVIAATPLGRTGTAEEVADAVVFLLSDQARFITGHDLVIDGGLGLPGAGIDATIRGLLAKIERS